MSTIWRGLVAIVLWRSGWLRPRRDRPQEPQESPRPDPSERLVGSAPWAEPLVALVLVVGALAALAFVVLFVAHPNTQLLGLALGGALALLAVALAVAGSRILPRETRVEERPDPSDSREVRQIDESVRAGLEGVTRRRLLGTAGGIAGVSLAAAVAIPVVGLGPGIEDQLKDTPWHRGRRLVDDQGKSVSADQLEAGTFLTAFPEGADKDNLGSPVIVVRVDPSTLRLPAARRDWAPRGIMAYSKICTHAACAISLFRYPLSPTTETDGPALVCPCHYSTFDVLDGGSVEFGPAGRALPQLPLRIDASGSLRAAGPMSGPVGPSWWGDSE